METLLLTGTEQIVFYIGSAAIFFGTVWGIVKTSKKKKKKVDLGIGHTKKDGDSEWWDALEKSRSKFGFKSASNLEEFKESVEEACIVTDLGVQNTHKLLEAIDWNKIAEADESERISKAKEEMSKILSLWLKETHSGHAGEWPTKKDTPTVLWFIGTNGVGKTTTIAKLAKELKDKGHSVMLAAGDTFRAAASEQLETWAKRLDVPCVRGKDGADSSAVLFDAIESAKSKKIDFLLCDSAGRLHNNSQLMDNLSKNKRVMAKAMPEAPHESILVLDANTGQNMLAQSKTYVDDIGINGLILTKVDGTARGGALVAVSIETGLPIRRLGLGERPEDFKAFDSEDFSKSLLGL